MSLPLLWSNFARSALAAPIASGATTLTLTTGTGAEFPNPGSGQYFVGVFTDIATGQIHEIVHVTARSTDTLTIVRAQEGTSALAWVQGDLFALLVTAGGLSNMIQGQAAINTVSTAGSGSWSAANMLAGVINRTGPGGAYADATDTATALVGAIPFAQVGLAFRLRVLNTVAFANTITAGSGVTLAGTTAIAASTWRDYLGTITNVGTPAVTLTGIGSGTL